MASCLNHLTLPDAAVRGKRAVVIGDVHGCFQEMMALLNKEGLVSADQQRIREDALVIFTGDIINKGPLNIEVLRFVKSSGAYAVLGNHELNILNKPHKYPWTSEMTSDDITWVRSLPYTITIPLLSTRVVHAGLLPNTALEGQTEFVMTRMRNIETLADGTMIPCEDTKTGVNWASIYHEPEHVVYGHDARRGKDQDGNPVVQWWDKATGLDTRCAYGGKLSGIYLPISESSAVTHVQCQEYNAYLTDYEADNYTLRWKGSFKNH